jgi:hypothetical protein
VYRKLVLHFVFLQELSDSVRLRATKDTNDERTTFSKIRLVTEVISQVNWMDSQRGHTILELKSAGVERQAPAPPFPMLIESWCANLRNYFRGSERPG